jgi:phosphoglycerate dehydrogenase-like enzyme
MKVLLTWYADEKEKLQIQRALPRGTHLYAPPLRKYLSRFEATAEDLTDEADDADVIMGWVLPPGLLDAAKALKALVWLHAGCDELDFELLKRRNIQVANVRGGSAIAVAEHAMCLMLGLAKRIIERHQAVRDARWHPLWHPDYTGVLLEGRILAVVGLGQIGTAVAKRAKAFDMTVLGVRRHPERQNVFVDEICGPEGLATVLTRADFTVLATPITAETEYFINDAMFRVMKPTAYLINIARGNLIVEQALYEALTENRLAGYASDVWWNYVSAFPPTYHFPIPSRTGIQHLPNVLASGDQGGNVETIKDKVLARGLENLEAFTRGELMPWAIDLDRGY